MMETEKGTLRRWDWRASMPIAVAATILLRLLVAANPPFSAVYAYLIALAYAAFAYPAVMAAKAKRLPGFALLCTGFVLVLLLRLFDRYTEAQTAAFTVYLLMLLCAICLCYPMAFVLPEARATDALTRLAQLFIGLMALLSLLGIFAFCTGSVIPSLAGAAYSGIGNPDDRLYAYLYPSAFALAAGLALLLLPYALDHTEKKCLRILLLVATALLYLGMALTGATIVQIVFAVCAGGFVFLLYRDRLHERKAVVRVLLALVLAALTIAVCFGGQWAVRRAAKAIAPAPVSERAEATTTPPFTAGSRTMPGATARLAPLRPAPSKETVEKPVELGFVALRVTLCKAAVAFFAENPARLLTGISPARMAERLAPYLPTGVSGANMRFLPMQALVAYGVPGLLVTLAFVLYVLFHAVRLFFCGRGQCTLAERSLALVPLFCLLLDCTDCYLTLTDVGGFASLWFFLSAGYVVLWSRERIAK